MADEKSQRATLMDADMSNIAPRIEVKDQKELWSFVKDGENGNAIVGIFAIDAEGGVIGRNDTSSHYGVFRDASTKNKDVPFGIMKDVELIKEIGIDAKRLPVLLQMHLDEDANHIECRKAQFFEDQTVYFSEDKTRVVTYLKKGEDGSFSVKDMRPKGPNPNAAKKEPLV